MQESKGYGFFLQRAHYVQLNGQMWGRTRPCEYAKAEPATPAPTTTTSQTCKAHFSWLFNKTLTLFSSICIPVQCCIT